MQFEWFTALGAFVNFFVLLFLLKKFLYKPVLAMLDKRKEEVMSNMQKAEDAKNEAEGMLAQYTEQMKDARNEAQEIISNATKIGEQTKTDIVNQAREEAAKLSAKAQEEIQREKAQAIDELRSEVANIAVLAAEKIVAKSINVEDHKAMVNNFVQEVGEAK